MIVGYYRIYIEAWFSWEFHSFAEVCNGRWDIKILQKLTPKRENASHNVITENNVTLHDCYKSH